MRLEQMICFNIFHAKILIDVMTNHVLRRPPQCNKNRKIKITSHNKEKIIDNDDSQ